MLEQIFGTELKVKILNLFFSQEDNLAISSQEIAKKLALRGVVWRRDLNDLVDLGLLHVVAGAEVAERSEEKTKNTKKKTASKKKEVVKKKKEEISLKINSNFFLFTEIKALLAKSKIISTTKVFKDIEEKYKPKLLILSGKFSANKDALADVLVVGNIPKRGFAKLISDLEKSIGEEINYSIMTEEEFEYRRFVMDIFVYNIINNDNIILLGNIEDLSVEKNTDKD